jgi:tetratricopeptide (TPR) repeat protein
VTLFEVAAQRSCPDFEIDDDALPVVVEICRLVGGLPLAIELVAAHAGLLSIRQLEEQLDRVLDADTSTRRDGAERHRTMQRTIDWSYQSLSASEQELLGRLAVFRATPSWNDVRAIASGDDVAVFAALASLTDKCFLRSRDTGGVPRFVMPVLIRRFAIEASTRAGTLHDARDRHAAHINAAVAEAENERWRSDTDAWFVVLSVWWDDIDQSLAFDFDTGNPVRGAATVARLYASRLRRGDMTAAEQWTARAMPHVDDLDAIDAGLLHTGAGYLAFLRHDTATAHDQFRRALDKFEQAGHARYVALAMVDVAGTALGGTTNLDSAISRCLRGVELAREVGEPSLIAHGVNVLGELYRYAGANESAQLAYEEALELARSRGDRSHVIVLQLNLAALAIEADDASNAGDLTRDALHRASEIGATHLVASALAMLAGVLARTANPELAARVLGASDAALAALGASRGPSEVPADQRLRDRLSAALGGERFRQLVAEGALLSLDDAVALATGA